MGTFKRTMSSRTVLPSLHPCPASGGATGFLPASALSCHEALRPPGAEDARCVQPTSATQTICVYPHLARSRLAPRLSPRGHLAESKALRGSTGGTDVSRRPNRFGGSTSDTRYLVPFASRLPVTSVGVFGPTAPDAIEPLTSLSPLPLGPRAHAPSRVQPSGRPVGRHSGRRVKEPPRP